MAYFEIVSKYLQQRFGDLSQVKKLQELSFDIDGKRQYVLVQPYSDPRKRIGLFDRSRRPRSRLHGAN